MKYYVIVNNEYVTTDNKTTKDIKLATVFSRNEAFAKARELNGEVIAE